MLSENIFTLRYGFQTRKTSIKRMTFDEVLVRVLANRSKKLRAVELLLRQAKQRNDLFSEWGRHSETLATQKKVRILSDIVVLCQEKNLLLEAHGAPEFIKVGEIEHELNWPLRVEEKYGPIEDQDYFTRRMRV